MLNLCHNDNSFFLPNLPNFYQMLKTASPQRAYPAWLSSSICLPFPVSSFPVDLYHIFNVHYWIKNKIFSQSHLE